MLKPFVKWPGGKSEEITDIKPYCPKKIRNYVEPFLGGGAFFLSLDPDAYQQAYLNDFSKELIGLYAYIKNQNPVFYRYLDEIWVFWRDIFQLFENHIITLTSIYQTKNFQVTKIATKINHIVQAIKIDLLKIKPSFLNDYLDDDAVIVFFEKAILKKMIAMKRNEVKLGILSIADYRVNFETGVKNSIYMIYRHVYNQLNGLYLSAPSIRDTSIKNQNNQSTSQHLPDLPSPLHVALFYYLREFCYSSMFRYNKLGAFNVPYGGISYHQKKFDDKILYTQSQDLQDHLKLATLYAQDFEDFLEGLDLNEDDFIFLDPPYDSDFSCYANQSFDQTHQTRLAQYLIHRCQARFMVVIKYTPLIEQLYARHEGIQIYGFDKDYRVSFKNRNDRKVKHLLITNHSI